MICDMPCAGKKLYCTLHIYFSSSPRSAPLPAVGEGPWSCWRICVLVPEAGPARGGARSQKWEREAVGVVRASQLSVEVSGLPPCVGYIWYTCGCCAHLVSFKLAME